jgi:hypothetical protein
MIEAELGSLRQIPVKQRLAVVYVCGQQHRVPHDELCRWREEACVGSLPSDEEFRGLDHRGRIRFLASALGVEPNTIEVWFSRLLRR